MSSTPQADAQSRRAFIVADAISRLKAALCSPIGKNAASLYLIQLGNYILPLITIPYLVRSLGPSGYGVVAFAQSLISYFNVFVDYGFNLSGTRRISVVRNDRASVSENALRIWGAKALLCVVGLVVLLLLLGVVSKFREIAMVLLVLYGTVVGNALFPVWLFQGMEKMVFISIIKVLMQCFVAVGVFTMIHEPGDFLVYAGLIGIGSAAAGLAGAALAFVMFKLRIVVPRWRDIWETFVEGWMVFLSTGSCSLYTVGNAFILGLVTNHTVVGYYSAAEKIVKVAVEFLGPLTLAAYPRFSELALTSKTGVLRQARHMFFFMSGLGAFLSIALFVSAPVVVTLLLGTDYRSSVLVVRILAGLPLLIGASNVLGIQIMLPFGKDKVFASVLIGAGLINVALAILLAPFLLEVGMAVAVLLSETFVTGAMLIYLSSCRLSPARFTGGKELTY